MASQGKGGKLKGSNFERKIAKVLEVWWVAGGLEGEFHKTPASGALRWEKRPDVIGDICTPEEFVAIIECKNTESWKYSELFSEVMVRKPPLIKKKGKNKGKPNSPRTIGEFWYQACDEAERASKDPDKPRKIPMLIFSKNYQKDLIITPVDAAWNIAYRHLFRKWEIEKHFVWKRCHFGTYPDVLIMRFDKFLEIVDPKMLSKD